MGLFSALDTATSGASVSHFWIDAIADNVANVNSDAPGNAEPFRARMVEIKAKSRMPGGEGGAEIASVKLREGDPVLVYDPTDPLADDRGLVAKAHVDLGVEMTNMIIANRSYQANLRMVEHARDTYKAALQIGTR